MKNRLLLLLFLPMGLIGCQSMGEHFSCLSEVDRTVPAQTQQKYIRTDTKCIRSNEQTVTGAFGTTWGTVYNPGQGDINCSSTPIYETVVLNQAQRDLAYQNCRNNIRSVQPAQIKTPQYPTGQVETQYCKDLLQMNIYKWVSECSK